MKYFSKSKLKSKCKRGYLKGNKSSILGMMGSALHELIEIHMCGHQITMSMAEAICDKNGVPSAFCNEVYNRYKSWYKCIGKQIDDEFDIVSIESREEGEFKYGKPITRVKLNDSVGIEGMLDLIAMHEDRYEVWDWKSGHMADDCELELTVNGLLALERFNFKKVESRIYSVSSDMIKSKRLKMNKVNEYKSFILEKIAEFESKSDSDETFSSMCIYCSLKNECNTYLSEINGEIMYNKDEKDLSKLAAEYFRLKDISSLAKKEADLIHDEIVLRNKYESISGQGGSYEFKARNTKQYDTYNMYKAIKMLGHNPDSILKVSGTDLNTLLKSVKMESKEEWEVLKDTVKNFTTTKKGTPKLKKL